MDISTQVKGNWHELKGKVRQKWAKLTDDDIESLKGTGEEFYGRVEKLYGISKDRVKTELHSFFDKAGDTAKSTMNSAEQSMKKPNDRDASMSKKPYDRNDKSRDDDRPRNDSSYNDNKYDEKVRKDNNDPNAQSH